MERKWTPAQEAAITTRGKTLLISAAAGSGKTATLTERILRSLMDGSADIGSMLIVTYTRAAAAELRSRISGALSDALAKDPLNPRLNAQLLKLDTAKICTIDSFYLDLIRSNFSSLGLSPSFRIADTAEVDVLSVAIMNETIDFFYENDQDFPLFTECFSNIRGQAGLADVFLSVDTFCSSVPEGIEFLRLNAERAEKEADMDFFDTTFGRTLRRKTSNFADYLCDVFQTCCDYIKEDSEYNRVYGNSFANLLSLSRAIQEATQKSGSYEAISALLSDYKLPELSGRLKKGTEVTDRFAFCKSLRTSSDKKIKDFYHKNFSKSAEIISRAMHDTARYTQKLYEILTEYERRMDQQKKDKNFLTFPDLRRYALKILVNEDGSQSELAKSLADSFSEIYIDEYQDVDRVQDTIFRAISRGNNRFMVGDIKQSIYSFRGAEPQVFTEYRSSFPLHGTPGAADQANEAIFMSNNFRCDRPIIDFTNTVCSYLFPFSTQSMSYCQEDDLVFSKSDKDKDGNTIFSPKVQLTVILPPSKEEVEENDESDPYVKAQAESAYVASEIARLLRSGHLANGKRIRPGDIAVLSYKHATNHSIAKELRALGIPTSDSGKDLYFENPDVLMVLCLLNTIDNPHRDIYLSGALRSPIFSFSLEDLVLIRRNADKALSLYDALLLTAQMTTPLGERCRMFCEMLDAWRDQAASLPVDRLLRIIFDSEPFIASGLVNTETGSAGGGNLLLLYEYARNFERSSFKGLNRFIEFINTVMEEGGGLENPQAEISEEWVNLMTIHHSKGLEFPVCFVCGMGKQFDNQDSRESLLLDADVGIAMKIADGSGFARISTPMRESILSLRKEKDREEDMRLLYVALTRAREQLYVTGTANSAEKLIEKAEQNAIVSSRYSLLNCTSYLEWVMTALAAQPEKADLCVQQTFVGGKSYLNTAILSAEEQISTVQEKPAADPILLEKLQKEFAFTYPYAALSRIPAKISVSRLSPDVLDYEDTAKDLEIKSKKAEVPAFFREGISSKNKKSAAERGTATHLFLQFCDFANTLKNGVREEFTRLSASGFLPPDAEDLIYFEELERFFAHPILEEITKARKVIREQRFNLLLPAEHFSQKPTFVEQIRGEHLAVQGVMDLIVVTEDGRLCLYDYKTDRLTREELAQSDMAKKKMNDLHGMQLSYYKKAAEMLFGMPCDRLAVYSTHAAQLFDIEPCPLSIPSLESDT